MGLSFCRAENTVKVIVRCKKLENKVAKDKMQDPIGRWGKKKPTKNKGKKETEKEEEKSRRKGKHDCSEVKNDV